jgi:hypothetical protein
MTRSRQIRQRKPTSSFGLGQIVGPVPPLSPRHAAGIRGKGCRRWAAVGLPVWPTVFQEGLAMRWPC